MYTIKRTQQINMESRMSTREVQYENEEQGFRETTPKKENRDLFWGVAGMRGTKTNKVNDAIKLVGNYTERQQKL